MSRSDRELVEDILKDAAELTEIVHQGHGAFKGNKVHQRAAERLLEIVGEASGRLSEEFCNQHPTLPVRQAKAMRNLISHEYSKVNSEIIWETISSDIPAFAESLRTLEKSDDGFAAFSPMVDLPAIQPLELGDAEKPICGKPVKSTGLNCLLSPGHRGRCRSLIPRVFRRSR